MRRITVHAGMALALGALAVGCGGASAGEDSPRREAAVADEPCPLDWPGGFRERPYAKWVQAFVERAGYRVVDMTRMSLAAAGKGHEFSIWAVEDTPRDPHLANPDDFNVVARVGEVEVYGHAGMVDWWPSQGFHVWLGRGAYVDPVPPRPEKIAPLVDASLAIPAPPPC
jgi:hypothetical protein